MTLIEDFHNTTMLIITAVSTRNEIKDHGCAFIRKALEHVLKLCGGRRKSKGGRAGNISNTCPAGRVPKAFGINHPVGGSNPSPGATNFKLINLVIYEAPE